jgi:hypothetical protein
MEHGEDTHSFIYSLGEARRRAGGWDHGREERPIMFVWLLWLLLCVCYVRFEIIVEGVEWRGETLRRIEFSL